MNNVKQEFIFMWFIENYSYCWHENGVALISPDFAIDDLNSTTWNLQLHPRGCRHSDKGFISLSLHRSKTDCGPEDFHLKYELSFLAANGSAYHSKELQYTFKWGKGYGILKTMQMDEALFRREVQDNLCVRCKIWKGEKEIHQIKQIVARTRIGIERISFLHVTENFNALEPNQKKIIYIRSPSEKGLSLASCLYFTDGSCCDGKVMVEITQSNTNLILSKCEISVLNAFGKVIKCCKADNRFDAVRKDIRKLPLSLTKQDILNRKCEYLPDDKLTLLCECTFATGVEYQKIESTVHEIPSVVLSQINENVQNKSIYNVTEKLSSCPNALDDLRALYNNQLLADIELKTKTKSFPAHKNLLCARSLVFKAMMSSDMKEKNSNSIKINDLEDDTVEKFLIFLYSDNLENLNWTSAIKLYYASDKYEVEKLKILCSAFLLENISTSNASDLLLLADAHNDSELRKAVEDFIFKHEEEVYSSDEWGNLMEKYPLLVSKTMRLKYIRKF
ncbi:unnamed protein product [Larinioides sclopetarius]|uniref:Speckle-type POZ protein n=1 Tax=Larinioides sclopetarius TaxID=280406 RepID=A0AAV2AKF0_9ARAC